MGLVQSQMAELMPEIQRLTREVIDSPRFNPPAVPQQAGVYRMGNGVSAPIPIYQPKTSYPEEARAGKLVVKPLGLGLDEKAVEAIQQWRFKPGLKDGKPVPEEAAIDVTFHLL